MREGTTAEVTVGASAFHVCYGVRREVDASDLVTLELLEQRRHPWQAAAREHGLQTWWGVMADEGRYFLLAGKLVGRYGWEGESAGQLNGSEMAAVMTETAERLLSAGIEGKPGWHFQFEPDR